MNTWLFLFTTCLFGLVKENECFLGTKKVKIDCRYSHWGTWGKCLKKNGVGFIETRTREKFPERNGGKPCSVDKPLSEERECTHVEYMATLMMASLNSKKKANSGGGMVGFGAQSFGGTQNQNCQEFRNANGELIAYAACEDTSSNSNKRKKRNAGDEFVKHRDFLFLVDGSGSVGKQNYEIEKKFASAIVNTFTDGIKVDKDRTRVAMVTFDNLVRKEFDFREYTDRTNVLGGISKADYHGGGTCMSEALKYCENDMFTTVSGARLDGTTEQVIFMITDGCANCASPSTLTSIRKKLESKSITVLTVHIGTVNDCYNSLRALSDGTKCFQMFNFENWVEFNTVATTISRTFYSWDEFFNNGEWDCKTI